jgi:hypothetical protein
LIAELKSFPGNKKVNEMDVYNMYGINSHEKSVWKDLDVKVNTITYCTILYWQDKGIMMSL